MKTVSTRTMVDQLEGLLGTADVNDWESGFIRSMARARDENRLTALSEKQVERLAELHAKHFS